MMERVKKLIDAGLAIPAAIKAALAMPLTEFAEKYGLPHSSLVNHVNAIVRPSDDTIAALVAELGGTENEWRELLWQAMKPAHLAAS
jgi:hypothetical protein